MLAAPAGADLLDAVARLLRDTLIPPLPADAALRLQALLGHDGALPAQQAELALAIRQGRVGADSPGLIDHLWATTLAKLAIDQPSYAPYRHELEHRAAAAAAGSTTTGSTTPTTPTTPPTHPTHPKE